MDELKLREVAEPILEEEGLFLVDVVIKGNLNNQKVLLLADGEEGISIDQCGRVSRKIGNLIEEQDLIAESYRLEVSSPGLDFPLILDRQYHKNVGRVLSIELEDGESIEGELLKVEKEQIQVKVKNEEREYPFKKIKQSKVKISFK